MTSWQLMGVSMRNNARLRRYCYSLVQYFRRDKNCNNNAIYYMSTIATRGSAAAEIEVHIVKYV